MADKRVETRDGVEILWIHLPAPPQKYKSGHCFYHVVDP